MNWYKKANTNQEIINNPNFRGFHCQRSPQHGDDLIDPQYFGSYFVDIIDSVPNDIRLQILEGLKNMGFDEYDLPKDYEEGFEEWSGYVEEMLEENGIRWIFVSHDQIFNTDRSDGASYGNYCYYILMPDNIILWEDNDPHEINSSFIIYDSRQGQPTRIPMESNNELV